MLFVHLCLTFKYLIFVEKASNRGFLPSFVLGRSHKQVAGWSCCFEIPAQNWCEHTNSLFWGMIALQTVMNLWGCFLLSATEGKILTSWRGGSFFGPNYDSNPISRVLCEQQLLFCISSSSSYISLQCVVSEANDYFLRLKTRTDSPNLQCILRARFTPEAEQMVSHDSKIFCFLPNRIQVK